jgi:hypothetical protein
MKKVWMATVFCTAVFSCFAQDGSYAKKSLVGLENKYRDLLAQVNQVPLKERRALQQKAEEARQRWLLQANLVETKVGMDKIPDARPHTFKNRLPKWASTVKNGDTEVELRELPEVEEWIPHYGKSGRERRIDGEDSAIIAIDSFKYAPGEKKVKRYNSAKKVKSWQPQLEDQQKGTKNPVAYSRTRVLSFDIPDNLQKQKWWLYRKTLEEANWRRIYAFDQKGMNITDVAPHDEKCLYKFAPALKKPDQLSPDYTFIIDNKTPVIQHFKLNKEGNGLMKIEWKVDEKNLGKNAISISVFGEKNTMLLTHTTSLKAGVLPVSAGHSNFITGLVIEVKDLSGRYSTKAL